jgi:hypothetical protein
MVFLKQISSRKTHQATPQSRSLPKQDHTKVLATHWRPISFTLVVVDFGVKYINKSDVEHLISVLKQDYGIDTDWEGTRYLGLTLDWDYIKREVYLSMPGYIENALVRFGHEPPDKPQLQPYPHTIPTYGATVQYAKAADTSPAATKAEEKYIRQVIGVLLYYDRAVNSTIITGLSSLAAAQANPTTHTLSLVKWLLDYAATNPNARGYGGENVIFSNCLYDQSKFSDPLIYILI